MGEWHLGVNREQPRIRVRVCKCYSAVFWGLHHGKKTISRVFGSVLFCFVLFLSLLVTIIKIQMSKEEFPIGKIGKCALSWQGHIFTSVCQQWRWFWGAVIKKPWKSWALETMKVYCIISHIFLELSFTTKSDNFQVKAHIEIDLYMKMINLIHKMYSKNKR